MEAPCGCSSRPTPAKEITLGRPGALFRAGKVWSLQSLTESEPRTAVVRRWRESRTLDTVRLGQPVETTTGHLLFAPPARAYRIGTIAVLNPDVWSLEALPARGVPVPGEAPLPPIHLDVQRIARPVLASPDHLLSVVVTNDTNGGTPLVRVVIEGFARIDPQPDTPFALRRGARVPVGADFFTYRDWGELRRVDGVSSALVELIVESPRKPLGHFMCEGHEACEAGDWVVHIQEVDFEEIRLVARPKPPG